MPQASPDTLYMPFYYTPYIILPFLSAAVNAGLAAFALRRRHVPAAQVSFWLMLGMAGWSLAYTLSITSTSLAVKILCYKFGTMFACILAPSLLALALESVGLGRWLTRSRLLLVIAFPFIMLILAWTSEFHSLARYGFYLYTSGPLLLLGYNQGPLFTLFIFYLRCICAVAVAILISGFWRTPRSEWPRFILMISATMSSLVVKIVLLTPVRGFDTTTSAFLASGIFYSVAVFRNRLLDLVPIARQTLFEMLVEPVLVFDREGRLATANLAARELFLLPKNSGGTPATTILAPYPQFKSLVADSTDVLDGYVLDNGPLNRSWHITKSRIESGDNPHGWIIAMRDITMLHHAQHELRYSEERFRALAENLADTIWQMDKDLRFSYVSSADQTMRGFAPREVIGRSVYDILTDADAEVMRRLNKERIDQERRGIRTGTMRYEVQLKRKDKSLVWTEISSNPLRDADGVITSYIGSCRDISERKQAEEKLLAEKRKLEEALDRLRATESQLTELNQTLTQQVEQEMEKRLAHERMLARNARLAAMGEMIGAIAHQWRQPLATIGATIQSVRMAWERQRLDGAFMERVEADVQKQLYYMSDTIEEFRNFFQPEKESERFVVSDKLNDVVLLVGAQFANSGISLRVMDNSTGRIEVNGYPNEFKQAVLNLVSNSRDAILERRLKASQFDAVPKEDDKILLLVSDNGDRVIVEVWDNGCGIPEGIADKVFDPYFTTKANGTGTGIGLYMSRLIIEESMGGHLDFQSGPDGTAFRIRLNLNP